MTFLKVYSCILSFFLLCSTLGCQDKRKSQIAELVSEWQGKEIMFPPHSTFTIQGKDTIHYPITADHKVFVYVDSAGCTSCRLQLTKWKQLMTEFDSIAGNSVQFLFYITPKTQKEARYITRRDDFTHPVCIDLNNEIGRLNHFPKDDMFHVFLLDKYNKVKVIGNPIQNKDIQNLYIKILSGKESTKFTNTNVKIPIEKKDLGVLYIGEKKTFTYTICNTGDQPLFIYDVIASCECTEINFSKNAILPNEETKINVTYKADKIGPIDKEISIFANLKNSPITLKIIGKVK